MKILHISTFERAGGAAIAASRLHEGLRELGHESMLLVRERDAAGPVPGTIALTDLDCPEIGSPEISRLYYHAFSTSRAEGVDYLFSSDLPTRDFTSLDIVRQADAINVHWVAGMLSTPAIRRMQDLGKPVVWTLHDQAAFTGGCHYSGACSGYETGCRRCPHLRSDAADLPGLALDAKRQWLDVTRLTVVTPSAWLAACARGSLLLRDADVHVIPYSLSVGAFQRVSRADARNRLNLPADALVCLVGADRLRERRKGHDHVAAAFRRVASDPRLRERIASGQILCAAFGEGELDDPGIPVLRLGRLSGDDQTALAYRAADLFLLPTLEDNLPNTLLEAIAAGTPVISYETGGVPDLLRDGECGRLVPRGDVDRFAAAIAALAIDSDARERMRSACLNLASERLELPIQARAYLNLYDSLLRKVQASRADTQMSCATAGRHAEAVGATESNLLAGLTSVPALASRLLAQLAEHERSHQDLIASRGGEIVALNAALREKDDALHQAGRERQQLEYAFIELRAERAALRRRLSQVMKRVVIFGSGDAARRAWEALVQSGGADVAGFVDTDERRHGRRFLGSVVHPLEWLKQSMWDVVVVATSDAEEASRYLSAAGILASRIMVCADDSSLEKSIAARFPDSLASLMALASSSSAGTRVGIFGTGAGAMRVWEALAEIDGAEVVWFADNNAAQQGRALLWVDVIAPAQIVNRDYDVVVIGSMSRDPILKQLLQLGVARERIVAPDVVTSTERVRDQLAEMISSTASEVAR